VLTDEQGGARSRIEIPTLNDWHKYAPRVRVPAPEHLQVVYASTDRIRLNVNGRLETFTLGDDLFWDWIFEKEELPMERIRYEPVNEMIGWEEFVE
jgi:hypothetical protein